MAGLHPQAAAVLAQMPSVWREPELIEQMTVEAARGMLLGSTDSCLSDPPLPAGVVAENVEIPGSDGPLRARVYRPSGTTVGTVLWCRGGGFVLGSLETDTISAPLAAASSCAVVSFEYRLAPEHPFPAATEDAVAALRWTAENAPALGGERLGLGGESAGGNLAAVTALQARHGGPALAVQVLLYPITARHFDGVSRRDPSIGAFARPEAIEWVWEQYLGGADGLDPFASPLNAETLAGLPPAFVITAEFDAVRDEGEAYARRLAAEGVPVKALRFDGMPHGFVDWVGVIDAADECVRDMGAAFHDHLAPVHDAS